MSDEMQRDQSTETKGPVEKSARSVIVKLENQTSAILMLQQDTLFLDHGEWVIYPPQNIYPTQTAEWRTDSNGFMTGTEGRCTYQFIAGSQIANAKIHWDNPYVGGNSYSISVVPPPYSGKYDGGSGDNATVTFHVYRVA